MTTTSKEHRDQRQNRKFIALKEAIREGLDSGASERTVEDIWRHVELRRRASDGQDPE